MRHQFRIIPVLDLKDGIVVHGVSGERDKYQPIKSSLTASAEFAAVLGAFEKRLGLRKFYVADLDAIISGGRKDQFKRLLRENKPALSTLSFMVDGGVTDVPSVGKIMNAGADHVVVGTETLPSLKVLRDMIDTFGSSGLIMSIDTKDAKIISPSPEIAQLTPPQAIKEIAGMGIKHFILLELLRVGTGSGINTHLIEECLAALTGIDASGALMVGGGISGYEDLKWLALHGVSGALTASVLHSGQVDATMIRTLEGLK